MIIMTISAALLLVVELLMTVDFISSRRKCRHTPSIPSTPAPPKPDARGPWFLVIEWNETGRMPLYIAASSIQGISYNTSGKVTVRLTNGQSKTYHEVFRFYFVAGSQIEGLPWSEDSGSDENENENENNDD